MIDWFAVVLSVLLGQLTYYGLKWFIQRRRYPYRWTCDRCGFSLSTNVRETFEISKSSHNHISTEEYK